MHSLHCLCKWVNLQHFHALLLVGIEEQRFNILGVSLYCRPLTSSQEVKAALQKKVKLINYHSQLAFHKRQLMFLQNTISLTYSLYTIQAINDDVFNKITEYKIINFFCSKVTLITRYESTIQNYVMHICVAHFSNCRLRQINILVLSSVNFLQSVILLLLTKADNRNTLLLSLH